MILVCGGIKGGVGKTTLATTMAILRSLEGKDVLLVVATHNTNRSGPQSTQFWDQIKCNYPVV
jgi:chromosome partitioning protein